jgi:hypothetical protein
LICAFASVTYTGDASNLIARRLFRYLLLSKDPLLAANSCHPIQNATPTQFRSPSRSCHRRRVPGSFFQLRIQPIDAGNRLNRSAGVSWFSVYPGSSFGWLIMALRFA